MAKKLDYYEYVFAIQHFGKEIAEPRILVRAGTDTVAATLAREFLDKGETLGRILQKTPYELPSRPPLRSELEVKEMHGNVNR